jgi:hypothetical protein
LTVGDSDTVAPTAIDAVAGATVTVVTTGGGGGTVVTVTLDVPDFPAVVAVIVAEPAAIPATMPLALTAAALPSLLDQVTAWPSMTFPCASFTVAESEPVVPTTIDAVDGATVTVVTTRDGVGVGSVVVPPEPEHTERVGTRRSHHWRAARLARADIYGMSGSLRRGLELVKELPGNKMPPRHRQLLSDSLAARLAWRKSL